MDAAAPQLSFSAPREHGVGLALGLFAAACVIVIAVGSGFWLKLSIYAGIAAIGAIGLNLLTGNTGQVSLGHPFFMGVGAYTAAYVGQSLGAPFPIWIIAAIALSAAIGALIGPFALRLRGHYLVMVTFALIFIGQHVFNNWRAVTGGTTGRQVRLSMDLGFVDLARLPGLSRDQSLFILVWGFVVIVGWLAHNIVRSRSGRALMAIRDREITAEVVGVDVARYKINVFVLSSGIAGLAGALYGAYVQYTSPLEWSLFLGIQYLAMIIVGGMGSVAGAVIGAVSVTALPYAVQAISIYVPGIAQTPADNGFVTIFALNQILFGVLIVVFLIAAPGGLTNLSTRLIARLRSVR